MNAGAVVSSSAGQTDASTKAWRGVSGTLRIWSWGGDGCFPTVEELGQLEMSLCSSGRHKINNSKWDLREGRHQMALLRASEQMRNIRSNCCEVVSWSLRPRAFAG